MTSLLPNPEITFFSNNGIPLAGGLVYTYVANTLSPKLTWVDPGQATANSNPVVLSSSGRAIIYGSGDYTFKVTDSLGNVLYTQLTSAYLPDSAISAAMLPVVGAATTMTAIDLLGIPAYIAGVVGAVALMPGPTGPLGPTGPVGPQGSTGSAGSLALNIQGFSSPGVYTWNNPGVGTLVEFEGWSAGGGGGTNGSQYGGGGAGCYFYAKFPLANLSGSSVTGLLGGGGQPQGVFGQNGGPSSFGPYFSLIGGSGGNGNIGTQGAIGYATVNTGSLTLLSVYQLRSVANFAFDQYGNPYFSEVGAPTSGFSFDGSNTSNPFPSTYGGTGGGQNANGSSPGGGGGGGSGAGGNAQIVITVY